MDNSSSRADSNLSPLPQPPQSSAPTPTTLIHRPQCLAPECGRQDTEGGKKNNNKVNLIFHKMQRVINCLLWRYLIKRYFLYFQVLRRVKLL